MTQILFFFSSSSHELFASSYSAPFSRNTFSKPSTNETVSTATKIIPEIFEPQLDTQLTQSIWEMEFARADFEEQNETFLLELNLKVYLRCAYRARVNAKLDSDRADSNLEI